MDTLIELYRGGVWLQNRKDVDLFNTLLTKGYAEEEFGYCFITGSGLILLVDIGAIQV
jgi:hypothetical protein